MLIGIDMIGAQSPEGGDRLSGRFARRLAAELLGRDSAHCHVLYLHEGMDSGHLPARRDVPRVTLAPVAGTRGPARRRLATQRLIDRNPDGLDWLILLDPFEPHYGGPPPEAAVGGLRVASVVTNLSTAAVDDRALRPLARHDLILAVGDAVADAARRRLGGSRTRVRAIEPGTAPRPLPASGAAEPMTPEAARVLGDLGIRGRFVLVDASAGLARPDLLALIEAYASLPLGLRAAHQLVVMGPLADPDPVRWRCDEHGCLDRLLLTGTTPPGVAEALLDRCSLYLSPATHRDAPLALVEAMGRGAAIVAGRSGSDDAAVGGVAAQVDPAGGDELAANLAALLHDPEAARGLRARAARQADAFPWDATVDGVVSALGEIPDDELGRPTARRAKARAARPRVALFPSLPEGGPQRYDLGERVPAGLGAAYLLDLYLDAADLDRVAGLPVDFGGFDRRLFGRNDAMLGYQVLIYEAGSREELARLAPALRRRPGLVRLVGDGWDRARDEADLRAVESALLGGSRLVAECPWLAWRLRAELPGVAGRVAAIAPDPGPSRAIEVGRAGARHRLGLPAGGVVIGRFRAGADDGSDLAALRAFKDVARTRADVALALVEPAGDAGDGLGELMALAGQLRIADRVFAVEAEAPGGPGDWLHAFDLALFQGDRAASGVVDLLRAGVPTVAAVPAGTSAPPGAVRLVEPGPAGLGLGDALRALVADPDARRAQADAATRACLGGEPDPTWVDLVERCRADRARVPGRAHAGHARAIPTPHFPRAAATAPSSPAAAAFRSR